jgi:RNA polymerase sigma-70 factor (ECF subfamily)
MLLELVTASAMARRGGQGRAKSPEVFGLPRHAGESPGVIKGEREKLSGRGAAVDEFEALYHRRAHGLFAFFLNATGRTDVAEDLAAEVFVRVVRAQPRFPHPGAEQRWFQVTRDRLLKDWRRHVARERIVSGAEMRDAEPAAADRGPDLAETLWIKELVARLTPEQADVVALHFGEDLPLTEVAHRLGIAPDAARSRLHRALRQMKAWMTEEAPADPLGRTTPGKEADVHGR